MRITDLHCVERQRFPMRVEPVFTAEWIRRRRVFLLGFFIGLGAGLCATWVAIFGGLI